MSRPLINRLYLLLRPGLIVLALIPAAGFADREISQVNNVLIPPAFARALQEGMNIPLSLHLLGNKDRSNDQRMGYAAIRLQGQQIIVRFIDPEEQQDNAEVSELVRRKLSELTDIPFDQRFQILITANARLQLNLQQLVLQLVVNRSALGERLQKRSQDIGASDVRALSSSLRYNLGMYHNQARNRQNSSSGYLSFNDVTSLSEHHMIIDGALYGTARGRQTATLYKTLYERDFSGYRFAAGMLDSWNLQSLGPVSALAAGKIYGLSWGNQSRSTVFDNSQSVTPVIVFLPAAGEVHISRQGKLISVQNFTMGNHEVDTRNFPYGLYDVDIVVMVNGAEVSQHTERINKLFNSNSLAGRPLAWQFWGGQMNTERWQVSGGRSLPGKRSLLIGSSGQGSFGQLSWAASGYSYDSNLIGETRFSLPVTETFSVNHQMMLANDNSYSTLSSLTTTLPGGFSSLWLNHEITRIGHRLRRSDASNRAIGGTLNLSAWQIPAGTLSASYNDDRLNSSHYYTADYYQTLFSGAAGTLGLRLGVQRFNNGDNGSSSNKYIALDFSLQFGQIFSIGLTHQKGYTLANLDARQQFTSGTLRAAGANLATVVSGDPRNDNRLSGGGYARFDNRYSAGTVTVNSSAEGNISSSLTASGSLGWQGNTLAASSNAEDTAGVLFRTGLQKDEQLSASINGQTFDLRGPQSYLPLPAYVRYDIEILNNQQSADSFQITRQRKQQLTLYPGNVAVIEPQIQQQITVFGRLYRQDGAALANTLIQNGSHRSYTDSQGEFVIDIDKNRPLIRTGSGAHSCSVAPDLQNARGAVWIGNATCLPEGLTDAAN